MLKQKPWGGFCMKSLQLKPWGGFSMTKLFNIFNGATNHLDCQATRIHPYYNLKSIHFEKIIDKIYTNLSASHLGQEKSLYKPPRSQWIQSSKSFFGGAS
jgi:hypothetical protein